MWCDAALAQHPMEDTYAQACHRHLRSGLLTPVTAAAPQLALAHDRDHRGSGREHHGGGAAIALGILGGILAGTAIASSQSYYAPPVYCYQPPNAYYPPYYGHAGYRYYG